jgi:hypothetical protein
LTQSDRDTAADLAQRLKRSLGDPSKADEAERPPEDQPPKFADVLMSEKTPTPMIDEDAGVSRADWELIVKALEHYARSATG